METQFIDDEKGAAWLQKKLEQLDAEIRKLESLKQQRDITHKMLVSLNGKYEESEIKLTSEMIIDLAIELIDRFGRPITNRELLYAIETKGIQFGTAATKKTATLASILSYETNKRKKGARLVSVKRGLFDKKK